MPHFIIDCSEHIMTLKSPDEIMRIIHDTADASKLFAPGDIKVRINPFKYYTTGNTKEDFIHVFANIMEGRDVRQKSELSKKIIGKLKSISRKFR